MVNQPIIVKVMTDRVTMCKVTMERTSTTSQLVQFLVAEAGNRTTISPNQVLRWKGRVMRDDEPLAEVGSDVLKMELRPTATKMMWIRVLLFFQLIIENLLYKIDDINRLITCNMILAIISVGIVLVLEDREMGRRIPPTSIIHCIGKKLDFVCHLLIVYSLLCVVVPGGRCCGHFSRLLRAITVCTGVLGISYLYALYIPTVGTVGTVIAVVLAVSAVAEFVIHGISILSEPVHLVYREFDTRYP